MTGRALSRHSAALAAGPAFSGSGPYHSRARIQLFQAFAAPFPGDLRWRCRDLRAARIARRLGHPARGDGNSSGRRSWATPPYQILGIQGCRAHTISGRGRVATWAGGDVEALVKEPNSAGRQLIVAETINRQSPSELAEVRALALALNDALRGAAKSGPIGVDIGQLEAARVHLKEINVTEGVGFRADEVKTPGDFTVDALNVENRSGRRPPPSSYRDYRGSARLRDDDRPRRRRHDPHLRRRRRVPAPNFGARGPAAGRDRAEP